MTDISSVSFRALAMTADKQIFTLIFKAGEVFQKLHGPEVLPLGRYAEVEKLLNPRRLRNSGVSEIGPKRRRRKVGLSQHEKFKRK